MKTNSAKRINLRRESITIIILWGLAAGVLFAPYGVISQIYRLDVRIDKRIALSPLGKLCYKCKAPATHSASYSNGKIYYFCDRHWPPPTKIRTFGLSTNRQGDKNWSAYRAIGLVGIIYGPNLLRIVIHLFSLGKVFKPTLKGAIFGIFGSLAFWVWFATR